MRGFVSFCINRPVFIWCSVTLFVLLGISSYGKLGVTLYPNVTPPIIMVRTVYEGANPEEIEEMVTKPLEDALANLDGLKEMTSYSQDGVSLVGLFFDEDANTDLKAIDVENKIRSVINRLPSAAEEPVLSKFDMSLEPFMVASFSSDLSETLAKKIISDRIEPAISRIEGVGQVQVMGGLDREIHVILDPAALEEHKISYQEVCARIAGNAETLPAGYISGRDERVSIRMIGAFTSLEELEAMTLPGSDGQPVSLALLGRVDDSYADRGSLVSVDGHSVIQLLVSARPNADIVKAGAAVKREIFSLISALPEFSVAYTQDDSDFVRVAVKGVIGATGIGIFLTALVIYMFLGRLSSAFIVAVAMPVAFAATIFPISLHGYSLNLMTTLGLGLSMGVLVDNAILVLENICRFQDMGYEPFESALLGTTEISASVMAGVLTNLGVFLPVALMSGVSGQFLAPFAFTILYATLFSLWVTLSVVPSMAARLIGKTNDTPPAGRILTGWWVWLFDGLRDLFLLVLKKTLRHPAITLIFFVALTVGAFALGAGIPMEVLPTSDNGMVTVNLKFSNNFSLDATMVRTMQIENMINAIPEAGFFERVITSIGGGEMDQSLFKSQITVQLKDIPGRPETDAIADKIRSRLGAVAGVEYSVLSAQQTFGPDPIEVQIKGPDFALLQDIAEKIRARGENIPGAANLSLSTEMGRSELRIKPIRWRASQFGIDASEFAEIVKGYLNGNKAGFFREGGEEYDIKVLIDPRKRSDIYAIGQLPVITKFGAVPLEELADAAWGDSPTEIRRTERERTLTITGNVRGVPLSVVLGDFKAVLDDIKLPPGYTVRMAGEAEDMEEDLGAMALTILLAVVVTFLVIASILESWAYAAIILFSVPMSAIGVVPLMLATGANISIIAMIGMVMLVGLVVNNAIIVVDSAEILRRDEGLPPGAAIEKSCDIRFKSVTMGVVTSIVSFMPLAMATGRGSEFRWPVAIVAIGGLMAGGLLALLAIPAAYKLYWNTRGFFSKNYVSGQHSQADIVH
ncbi:MAG: efflux RND transporter permease subunit [Synergistaceae bacterium]|jgi:HAE1 family hydrophobic/amphiphilic exporter-1|nr:efflux RND transporter permease subunit [Synergistaceae bacterium]